jgi:hypothetical protein
VSVGRPHVGRKVIFLWKLLLQGPLYHYPKKVLNSCCTASQTYYPVEEQHHIHVYCSRRAPHSHPAKGRPWNGVPCVAPCPQTWSQGITLKHQIPGTIMVLRCGDRWCAFPHILRSKKGTAWKQPGDTTETRWRERACSQHSSCSDSKTSSRGDR